MKDYASYAKENQQLEEKLDKIKADSPDDEYAIKKMSEQVFETTQMLPNTKTRIETALEDLKSFLSEHEENDDLKAVEEWKLAEQTLAEAAAFVETI